jgi:hypothetical protein
MKELSLCPAVEQEFDEKQEESYRVQDFEGVINRGIGKTQSEVSSEENEEGNHHHDVVNANFDGPMIQKPPCLLLCLV